MAGTAHSAGTVTIFGGSGFVGSHLVQRLVATGWRIRVAVRRPHEGPQLRTMGDVGQVQVVQANVRDEPSVKAAVEGADVVINLAGIALQAGKQKFGTINEAGAGNVARAAAAAGARQLIHMSTVGADANATCKFLQTKGAGEAEVREAFPAATVVRPCPIFGPEDGFITRFADMVKLTPIVPLIGMGKTRYQPVHINDVVDALVAVIGSQGAAGKICELGGPDILTHGEIKRMIARELDRPRFFVPWPFSIAKINGWFLQLTYSILRIPPLLTADQVELMKVDRVAGEGEGILSLSDLKAQGDSAPVCLAAVLPEAMQRFRRYGQYDEQIA